MSELWDLVDENGIKTGQLIDRKNEADIPEGLFRVAVEIWTIYNGKLLATKRHENKMWGGLWEATGGAVRADEDSIAGALRELKEETGIEVEAKDLLPLFIDKPMMYSRGTRFQYNNTGYVILAMIIEKITGMEFDE